MKIISHRGNLNGPDLYTENTTPVISKAIELGFDVEIDVWFIDGNLYLGHDEPGERIDYDYLKGLRGHLWVHAKNHGAFSFFTSCAEKINFFWHEEDQYTLTSSMYIWAYPGKAGDNRTVTVMPEIIEEYDISLYYGVCTDYPIMLKETGEIPFNKKGA